VLVLYNKTYFHLLNYLCLHYCQHAATFIGNTHESNQQVIRALGYRVKQVNDDIDFMLGHFFTIPLISYIALSQNVHELREIKK